MKNVTLILTIYKSKEEDLIYWSEAFKFIKKFDYSFFVIIDEESRDDRYLNYFDIDNLYWNDKNLGKFGSVYSFLKRAAINTSHIKICDPDDRLDLELFLSKDSDTSLKWDMIYLMKVKSFSKRNNLMKIRDPISIPNASAILPWKLIKSDKFYKTDYPVRNWLEDQIIGLICTINKAEIINLDYSWYIYNTDDGMTNKIKEDDVWEIINALKTFEKIIIDSDSLPISNFPGELKYIKKIVNNSTFISESLKIFAIKWFDDFVARIKSYKSIK